MSSGGAKKKEQPFFDQYWFRFLVGGFVVATTASLASSVSTALAAILWSAPITLLPTLFFMWHERLPSKKIATFSYQTVYALINLMVFVVSLAYFVQMPYFQSMKNGTLWAIMASIALWCVGSLFLYFSGIGPF